MYIKIRAVQLILPCHEKNCFDILGSTDKCLTLFECVFLINIFLDQNRSFCCPIMQKLITPSLTSLTLKMLSRYLNSKVMCPYKYSRFATFT